VFHTDLRSSLNSHRVISHQLNHNLQQSSTSQGLTELLSLLNAAKKLITTHSKNGMTDGTDLLQTWSVSRLTESTDIMVFVLWYGHRSACNCTAWPRSVNSRFGGNITVGGISAKHRHIYTHADKVFFGLPLGLAPPLHTLLHPIIVFFTQHITIPSQPVML